MSTAVTEYAIPTEDGLMITYSPESFACVNTLEEWVTEQRRRGVRVYTRAMILVEGWSEVDR